jgi:hypothetical protein
MSKFQKIIMVLMFVGMLFLAFVVYKQGRKNKPTTDGSVVAEREPDAGTEVDPTT